MSEPRPLRSDILGGILAGLLVVGFCMLLLWRDPLVFWNDDYELSILPVFADVARSWNEGHWPLLSPFSWVCGNLAGEFQYGTFSVFVNAAVVLIWKFPLTFPQQAAALSITHLFVLAAGAFLLARDRALSFPLSIFVALVTALNGWIICWGATDWFGALGAFAWLPWAWWGLEKSLDSQRSRWRFLWPAPFVYLVITGGFPYTILMLVALIAWLAIKSFVQTKSLRSIMPMFLGVALGFGLAAPAWLAILDYAHGSVREQMQPLDSHWQWIVPWRALPGSILPCWTVNWADFSTRYLPHTGTELACGLVAPLALIAGFITRGRSLVRRIRWELILLLLVLVLCMIPTVGVFRWSFRWLPLFHLVLALCAAEALREHSVDRRMSGLVIIFLIGVTTMTMLIFNLGGQYAFPLTWILLGLAGLWTVSEFFVRNFSGTAWLPASVTFIAFLATYLCIPTNCGVPKYNLSQKLLEPAPLDPQRLYLSIYPPAEDFYRTEKKPQPVGELVRLGSTSMWAGLHFINGYSPILPAGVSREFDFRIHGEINLHEAEYLVWSQSSANGLLDQIGVDGLVVSWDSGINPALGPEWEFVTSTDEAAVYHRVGSPLARVRSVSSIDFRPNEQFAVATISGINDSRNAVTADVEVPAGGAPALLTFSRPYFSGYQARLGNQKLRVDSCRGLFPVVEVPAGSHGRLALIYRPQWLIVGGVMSVLSALIFAGGILSARSIRQNQYTSRL